MMIELRSEGRHRQRPMGLVAIAAATLLVCAASPAIRDLRPAAASARSEAHHADGWTQAQVTALLTASDGASHEGLDPADFGRDALQSEREQARDVFDAAGSRQLDTLADAIALALAHSYAPDIGQAVLRAGLAKARRDDRLGAWLAGLLPDDAGYAALRETYRNLPVADRAGRDRLAEELARRRGHRVTAISVRKSPRSR